MITRFFGDGEYAFAFTLPLLKELEDKTGCAIGQLFLRIKTGLFALNDLVEIVRLGLIGGGLAPKRAAELLAAYGPPTRPLVELQLLAIEIVADVWGGQPDTTENAPGTNGESTNG